MPSWKRVILSGSNAALNSLLVDSGSITGDGSGIVKIVPLVGVVETVRSSSFTASMWNSHPVNSSGGAVSVIPPIPTGSRDRFGVCDASASSATNNITVDFVSASQKLYGSVQNYVLNGNGAYIEFIYVGSTTGWVATK